MTMRSKLLNTVGLALVLGGSALLYYFGMPPDFDPTGAVHIIGEQRDESEIAKGKQYRFWGKAGFASIALGSVIEILATWL